MRFLEKFLLKRGHQTNPLSSPYVRVGALICENNKVLLVLHNYERGQLWHLPGGKIKETDRSLIEALKRELKEELEIEIEVDDLAFICEEELRPSRRVLHMIFKARRSSPQEPAINRRESGGSSVDFIPLNDISQRNLYPNISNEILSLTIGANANRNVYLGSCSSREWL